MPEKRVPDHCLLTGGDRLQEERYLIHGPRSTAVLKFDDGLHVPSVMRGTSGTRFVLHTIAESNTDCNRLLPDASTLPLSRTDHSGRTDIVGSEDAHKEKVMETAILTYGLVATALPVKAYVGVHAKRTPVFCA